MQLNVKIVSAKRKAENYMKTDIALLIMTVSCMKLPNIYKNVFCGCKQTQVITTKHATLKECVLYKTG